MPDEQYSVKSIPVTSEIEESRGIRGKFWLPRVSEPHLWLLKFPKGKRGDHWAEKVAYEVGNLVGISCARVELAECDGRCATVCESFDHTTWYEYWSRFGESPERNVYLGGTEFTPIGEKIADAAEEMVEAAKISYLAEWVGPVSLPGFAVLATHVEDYDKTRGKQIHQPQHNIRNIFCSVKALERHLGSKTPVNERSLLEQLATYMILDGMIANTDRHHQNWMLINEYKYGVNNLTVAPSFDHGSSLGSKLTDQQRGEILSSNGVLDHLRKLKGKIFDNGSNGRAPSPLDFAKSLCTRWPEYARGTLTALQNVDDTEFRSILDRIPSDFMSETAKDFAYEVMLVSRTELLESAR